MSLVSSSTTFDGDSMGTEVKFLTPTELGELAVRISFPVRLLLTPDS
jgi:hypothetical protein